MTGLIASGLMLRRSGVALVDGAGLVAPRGSLTVLIGPNGAGKSSLLRLLIGIERADAGTATIDGAPVSALSAAERARRIAWLPQTRSLAWPQRVHDIVALGRFAHGGSAGRLGEADAVAVDRALADCDLAGLADRRTNTLSGGELARVHLARALASEAPMLVADEPVTSLDPRHQLRVLALLRAFVARGGGALIVLHDLDLAAAHADRLVWMAQGRVVAEGSVDETLTADRIAAVYGVRAEVRREGGFARVMIAGLS